MKQGNRKSVLLETTDVLNTQNTKQKRKYLMTIVSKIIELSKCWQEKDKDVIKIAVVIKYPLLT